MIDVIGRPTAILMAFQEKDDDDEPVQGPSDLWSAVPAPENRWYSRGVVFARDLTQTIAIKRIEATDLTFKSKQQAEKHGLELCKEWIDSKRP